MKNILKKLYASFEPTQLSPSKNSWVLSVANAQQTKYDHYYFCMCSKQMKHKTLIYEPIAPELVCPRCGNDYFKDADEFLNIKGTKIWKYYGWDTTFSQNEDNWSVKLSYEIPIFDKTSKKVKIEEKELVTIRLQKDGSRAFHIEYKANFLNIYSLFLDDRVQEFKTLLVDTIKENLYQYVMTNRSQAIQWIDENDIQKLCLQDKLKYIQFFLKNSHLKEHRFFLWEMEFLLLHTQNHPTQAKMLEFLSNGRREKSLKKALFQTYEDSIEYRAYYPYSDYVFSRTIDDSNFLIQLYAIHPDIKQHMFNETSLPAAIRFIEFLKYHYTQKQITKLFVEEMQNKKSYLIARGHLRDTLRLLGRNTFEALDTYFIKVKPTLKNLHDEIIRVSHIVSYELDKKEMFEYENKDFTACGQYKALEFKLPQTVYELGLWAKQLHNCMFGYVRKIHKQHSIIYGVFKEEKLLYAVELQNMRIVQAKADFNKSVPTGDMDIVHEWHRKMINNIQT